MGKALEQEMRAASHAISATHLDRLRALGCSGEALAHASRDYPAHGVARIEPQSDDYYQPSEGGKPALIVPVCCPSYHAGIITPTITIWHTLDLIAFHASNPARWFWRNGNGWALGAEMLHDWQGEPVPVVATPLDWLRAGGDAVCLLDWTHDSPAWALLRIIPQIVTYDDLFARRLGNAIASNTPQPAIQVETPAWEAKTYAA